MRKVYLACVLAGCAGGKSSEPVETDVDTEVADTQVAVDPLSWGPGDEGAWSVGYQSWEVVYEPMPGESRTILLNVWYPTEATSGDSVNYSGLQPDETVFGNAPPAPPAYAGGAYPVMAYSHGDQAWGASSAFLMRWFASHGWVAIAPDHTGNLLLDNVTPTPVAHWYHRPLDVSAALDTLENLEDGHPLAGLADTSRVVLSGHSRGTYTVWSAAGADYEDGRLDSQCADCSADQRAMFEAGFGDERLVAFIPMAGTIRRSWFGELGHRTVAGPFLALTGSADSVGQQDQFDTVDEIPFTWVDVEGGCHQTFALGACDTLDVELGFDIIDTYALAFARHHVLGDDSEAVTGILSGEIEVAPEALFQQKGVE